MHDHADICWHIGIIGCDWSAENGTTGQTSFETNNWTNDCILSHHNDQRSDTFTAIGSNRIGAINNYVYHFDI